MKGSVEEIYGICLKTIEEIVKGTKPFFEDRLRSGEVKVKGPSDFVTAVDMEVQKWMYSRLQGEYPYIQFMSEEKENQDLDLSKPLWILDPVDGTTNLMHDLRNSALSLALYADGAVQMGIIYQPYMEEFYVAVKGKGAFCNGNPIHVSDISKIEESLVAVGTSPYHHELAEVNFKDFQKIFLHCADIRRSGSAAIDLAWVACGRTEAFFERNLKPWDYAAGLLLVEEAGGKVTDFQGKMPKVIKPSDILAGNKPVGTFLRETIFFGETEKKGFSNTQMEQAQCEQLACYQKMQGAIKRQYDEIVEKLETMKADGKTKSATYRQYMGNKLMYKNMLDLYRLYDLEICTDQEKTN